MIGDILFGITEAEEHAAKIIEAAQVKTALIESEATEQIRKINAKAEDEIAKITFRKTYQQPVFDFNEEIKLEVPKEKIDAAKSFIVSEFYKRFAE